MMALPIPGPKSPEKDFDLVMEPLLEELEQLWRGVLTRDLYSSPPAHFFLCAIIIWCIHDYPALGTMSGRMTHGYNACFRCDRKPLSYAILARSVTLDIAVSLPRTSRILENTKDMCSIQSMKTVMRQRGSPLVSCKWN